MGGGLEAPFDVGRDCLQWTDVGVDIDGLGISSESLRPDVLRFREFQLFAEIFDRAQSREADLGNAYGERVRRL